MSAADPVEWWRSLFVEQQASFMPSLPLLVPTAVGFTAGIGVCSAVVAGTGAAPAPPPPPPAEIFLRQFGMEAVLYQPAGSIPPPAGGAAAPGVQRSFGTVAVTQILSSTANTFAVTTPTAAGQSLNVSYPPAPPIPVEWLQSLFAQLPFPQIPAPPNAGTANDTQAGSGIAAPIQIYQTSANTVGRALGVCAAQILSLQVQPPSIPAEWMLTLFLAQPQALSAPTVQGHSTSTLRGIAVSAAQGINVSTANDTQAGTAVSAPVGVSVATAPYIQRGVGTVGAVNVLRNFSAVAVQQSVPTSAPVNQAPSVPVPVLPAELILGQFGFDAFLLQPPPIQSTTIVVSGTAAEIQQSPGIAGAQVIVLGHAAAVQRGTGKAAVVLGATAVYVQRGAAKATPVGVGLAHAPAIQRGTAKSGAIVISVCTASGRQRSYVVSYGNAIIPARLGNMAQRSTAVAVPLVVNPNKTHHRGVVAPKSLSGLVRPKELAGVDSGGS